jgi:serine/threonine-protein kinase
MAIAPTVLADSLRIGVGVEPLFRLEATNAVLADERVVESGVRSRPNGPFRIGQVVGGTYEIVQLLGHGGMNVVYEARDLALRRRVALKVPLVSAYAAALLNEAQALAAIHNPAFVSVYNVGREGDTEFVVMERIFGGTLEARLDELREAGRSMPLCEVLRILVGIAEALSVAHGRGIAHRDLKPSNVILSGERVVLLDLGLFVPEVLVSPDNEVSGSVQYMAPEVILRDVVKGGGPLIDLYALGVIAFELLTNVTPFMADSMERILAKHVCDEIPDVGRLRPGVPAELTALVTELLAKSPKDRPPGAESVLWHLRDLDRRGLHARRELEIPAIDDDAHVALALKRSLENAFPRLHVETTTTPASAILEGRSLPDVVLVDLHMPEENGVEVCMRLLAIPAHRRPVIVAMSAQAAAADVDVLRTLGVSHFVPKDDAFLTAMSAIIGTLRTGGAMPRA